MVILKRINTRLVSASGGSGDGSETS
jgi:hypothetical protein